MFGRKKLRNICTAEQVMLPNEEDIDCLATIPIEFATSILHRMELWVLQAKQMLRDDTRKIFWLDDTKKS